MIDEDALKLIRTACFNLADNPPKRCFRYPQPGNLKVKKHCYFAVGGFREDNGWVKCALIDKWVDKNKSECKSEDFYKTLLETT